MESDFKDIPAISKLISSPSLQLIKEEWGEGYLKFIARKVVSTLRSELKKGSSINISLDEVVNKVKEESAKHIPSGIRAINASGILLHTGLGRAPIGDRARQYIEVSNSPNLVQFERSNGGRSVREEFIEDLLRELTGVESTTVVNNNAAAIFLILKVLTKGKEVIVSRSQLVEIGGSFRMPDIMAESGCKMVEVGTTNKTHLKDYADKISENTGAILFVHQSNFKIEGFAETPSISDLCKLGKERKVPVIADLGSGALVDLTRWNLPHELSIQEVVRAGIDVCCFSGDKLLGGPQAGIIVGKRQMVEKIRKDKFSRMFRVCKYTLRALEGTLLSYINEDYKETIPLYQYLEESLEDLRSRASKIISALGDKGKNFTVVNDESYLGGGSTPGKAVRSVSLRYESKVGESLESIVYKLRNSTPAVIGRIENKGILFNLRGVLAEEDNLLLQALKTI